MWRVIALIRCCRAVRAAPNYSSQSVARTSRGSLSYLFQIIIRWIQASYDGLSCTGDIARLFNGLSISLAVFWRLKNDALSITCKFKCVVRVVLMAVGPWASRVLVWASCSKALEVCSRHCAHGLLAALYMQQNLTRQVLRFEVENAAARILRRLGRWQRPPGARRRKMSDFESRPGPFSAMRNHYCVENIRRDACSSGH